MIITLVKIKLPYKVSFSFFFFFFTDNATIRDGMASKWVTLEPEFEISEIII